MTVLGGARPLAGGSVGVRPRSGARPAHSARPIGGERRRVARRDRANRRAHPVGMLLAVVLVTFLLGLVYLAQNVRIAAANYRIDQALAQRDDLYRQVHTIETSVLRWGTEPVVVERAQELGLDQLPTRTRLTAR
jgi:hypothetical protein